MQEPIYETETDSQTQRADLWLPRGEWRRDALGAWISRSKLLYVERTKSKVLLYSTGDYAPCPLINYNGKEY